jgi:signal transduction histidine kinase/ActR/RegA family two-component response regulator
VGGWEVDFICDQALFSPELCELLGGPPLAPMSIADSVELWLEEDRAAFRARLEQVRSRGERLTFEGRTPGPDGAVRWWRLFGEPVLQDGQCVALRGAAQEFTAWRDTVERERAALHAAQAMSGFLATMSHELRTPLNGILGMAQAMGRGELGPPQRERLGIILSSGEALALLLDDLLDLSSIDSGAIELKAGEVDPQVLADGARTTFSTMAEARGLSLGLTLAPGTAGKCIGDPRRVRQVLHNLISNAIKFTEHGSIRVALAGADEGLTFRIADTGVGIPSAKIGQVFDNFVQADASATRRHGGSGLGLAICRDLVALMNGDIGVESVEGQGTTFTVSLPLARAAASPPRASVAPPPTDAAPAQRALRVLAAEDNETNRRVLKALLGAAGIDPVLVANGREAVEAWRAAPWDIVLMDIQMPVMDGVAATRLMRKTERREGRAHTPIIAVTANAMSHHEAAYRAAGMDGMVAKPINLTNLIQAMDDARALQDH